MFVRLQHTGIMIHVPSNEEIDNVKNVIVSTIPTIHPGEIYSHDSDYEVIFDIFNMFFHFFTCKIVVLCFSSTIRNKHLMSNSRKY